MRALLDAGAGVQIEGEDAPQPTPEHQLALRVFGYLRNGMGGLDWAGLPYVVEHLGITDIPALMDHLLVIQRYKPPQPEGS